MKKFTSLRWGRITALFLLPWTLISLAQTAAAAPSASSPLYQVEVIVFRASSVGAGEDWNIAPLGRGFGSPANRGGAMPQVIRILTPAEYHLDNIEGGLRSSGAWRPVAHAAWIQTAANWGTRVGIPLAEIGIDVPGLSGSVFLERAPIYVHLGFDVTLANGANYTVREMRSVKYNDKQYFDHPAFGIIAMVSPIKRSEGASTR